MKPLPPNDEVLRQAAALLHECYRDPMTRACRRALVILAQKNGSASLEQAGKAVRLPKALKPEVLAAVPGPLLDLGLICPLPPAASPRHGEPVPFDARFEIVDRDACLRWLIDSFSSPTSGPPVPLARPAAQ